MVRDFGQVTVAAEVIRTTDAAILINYQGDEIWVPRKCCIQGDRIEEGDTDLMIARWWWSSNVE